ncbi:MAG: gliding motility-associated C-terminal domain-containing protein, partial [Bacteroidota bacterium]
CDSLVRLDLTVVPADNISLTATICEGDSIALGGDYYSSTGQYTAILTNQFGCDSTVNLDLSNVVCNIQADFVIDPINCRGENSGGFAFTVTNATPPLTYDFERLGEGVMGSGVINTLSADVTVDQLPAGAYLVNINDGFGNTRVLVIELPNPPLLSLDLQSSRVDGAAAVSCFGATDGGIISITQGGVPPYSYQWNTGELTASINDLPTGNYTLLVQDANGCALTDSLGLEEPSPIVFEISTIDLGCDDPLSGQILLSNVSGGASNYQYQLSDGPWQTESNFNQLAEGNYWVRVQDNIGCFTDTLIRLVSPIIPIVDAGQNQFISLGSSIRLSPFSSVVPDSVRWWPSDDLSCTNCPNPSLLPLTSETYFYSVTSVDGCVRSDSVRISVAPQRLVYAPNAFSPNGDGVNDEFRLYLGQDAEQVVSLAIYSRWGGEVFQSTESISWDGKIAGQPASTGLYVWQATVRFIDGAVQEISGELLLVY